jgi:hypothetical protein
MQKPYWIASKEIGLEVNSEKTKYMSKSRHQTAGQSNYIRVATKSFGKVTKFKYLGATLMNKFEKRMQLSHTIHWSSSALHSHPNYNCGVTNCYITI